MAEQTGIITLKGNVGRMNFYKTKNGYQARQKGGVSKERIMTDPKFRRTRENLQEFKTAAAAAKLIRRALAPALIRSSDKRMANRFFARVMQVLKSDPVSDRGERQVILGEWDLLRGFELNTAQEFERSMPEEMTHQDVDGMVSVSIPEFAQEDFLQFPTGTTHYRLYLLGAAVNLEDAKRTKVTEKTTLIPIARTSPSVELSIDKSQLQGDHKLFVVGMEYTQFINGQEYPLGTMEFNSGVIFLTERS